jgi:hypothetical protein
VPVSLILTEKAEEDLDDAYHWYEEQEPGLGKEFIRCGYSGQADPPFRSKLTPLGLGAVIRWL